MKLQPLFSEFLFTQGNLSLPGVGCLRIQQAAAKATADGTILLAPDTAIVFEPNRNEQASEVLLAFISRRLQISSDQVGVLLQENHLQQSIKSEGHYKWPLVGAFSEGTEGSLAFQPEASLQAYLPSISLQRIVSSAAEEREVASTMQPATSPLQEVPVAAEVLPEEPLPRSRWWIGAIIIFILSLLLIAYRYL